MPVRSDASRNPYPILVCHAQLVQTLAGDYERPAGDYRRDALDAPRRQEWCRWGERGLQRTWDPRYYYFSDKSYGSGAGTTENWLGKKHDQQPELGIELVNAELGIRFLQIGLEQGKTTVLLCTHKAKGDERCHWKVIVELLRPRMPDLQVIL